MSALGTVIQVSERVEVVEVLVAGGRQFEVRCSECDHVDIWEHERHAVLNGRNHVCRGNETTRDLSNRLDKANALAERNWQSVLFLQARLGDAVELLQRWMGYGVNQDNRIDSEAFIQAWLDGPETTTAGGGVDGSDTAGDVGSKHAVGRVPLSSGDGDDSHDVVRSVPEFLPLEGVAGLGLGHPDFEDALTAAEARRVRRIIGRRRP